MITPIDKIECMFKAYADDEKKAAILPYQVPFTRLFYDTLTEVEEQSQIAGLAVFDNSEQLIGELLASQYFGDYKNYSMRIIIVMMSQRVLRPFLMRIV